MRKWAVLLGCIPLIAGCVSKLPSSGIRQVIETRNGRRSVWGIAVTLSDCQFIKTVRGDQIDIVEEKYNSELKELMTWSVDESGHTLLIVFKPGTGDFGSDNDVHVRVNRSAITGDSGDNGVFEWAIPTDPL